MSANTRILEQQWRVRGLNAPAELRIGPRISAIAKVKEASLHGALVQTGAVLTCDSHVSVRPIPESGIWLEARVVGFEKDAVALEWIAPRLENLAILLTERMK